ncbi:MAG: Xaa-Pro peptidase family protein [Aerococcus sp.]|nr:Xaa-Pro peptidase family protein [Aerococcus sp.]
MSVDKLTTLRQHLQTSGLDLMIISDPAAISYYLNIEFNPLERLWLFIVPIDGTPKLIANELFVFDEPEDVDVLWVKDGDEPLACFKETGLFPEDEPRAIGIDKRLIADQLLPLIDAFPQFNFQVASELVDSQRAVKTAEEQEKMRLASEINDRAIKRLIEEVIPYGVTEIEACDELLRIYKEEGANQGFSFEPIVAYGANGADPHHESDDSRPEYGDAVVIDVGCRNDYYCSDMTRTVYYGEPSEEAKKVYNITLEAQKRGLKAAQVGRPLSEVDLAGRDYINEQGYGKYFTHRIGHFIGRETHEHGDVSSVNPTPIQVGNCFSVEPGIYLPGNTAVRIEDLLIAQTDGPEVLNHYTKELQVIEPKTKE